MASTSPLAEEIHTLGHLYESMLKEMRDTAGDSGEFYTPRSVVRFMVEVIDPRLGEVSSIPPAAQAVFSWRRTSTWRSNARPWRTADVPDRSLFGGEAKSLPYLLAQMNLLLHGLESPQD